LPRARGNGVWVRAVAGPLQDPGELVVGGQAPSLTGMPNSQKNPSIRTPHEFPLRAVFTVISRLPALVNNGENVRVSRFLT
jgi:hypothetical protein